MTHGSRWLVQFCALLIAATAVTSCNSTEENGQSKSLQPVSYESHATTVKTAPVKLENISEDLKIPSELVPFREIGVYPKVQGFVRQITVDRGSAVRAGQLLVQIQAPEIDAQCAEAAAKLESAQSAVAQASAKVQSSMSQVQEAKAKLLTQQALLSRIQQVAKTPGAIAPFDLEQAEQKVTAAKAQLDSATQLVSAAQSELESEKGKVKATAQSLASLNQMRAYLSVTAPFNGVVTERNVHEGSLVNSSISGTPMLRISEVSKLRLVIPVPESAASHIAVGQPVAFTVPAHGTRKFVGKMERISHNVDAKTRTMIVEADVDNVSGELEPGMYPEVAMHVEHREPSLTVPTSAIKEVEGKCVVMRMNNGVAQPVEVICRQSVGDSTVVFGALQAGDYVALAPGHASR